MLTLNLRMSSQELPPEALEEAKYTAIWQGRADSCGVISLETMLEERLIELRRKHEAWAYSTGIRNDLAKKLEAGATPSAWWTSLIYERHPRLSPQLYVIYKLFCVELWLKESGATALRVFGGSPDLRQSLSGICQGLGIACELRDGPPERSAKVSWGRKLYGAMPATLRAVARLGFWLATVRRRVSAQSELPPMKNGSKKSAVIVTYFPNLDMDKAQAGKFHSRYWESLHEALEGQAQAEGAEFVRWLFIHFPAPGLTFEDCVKLRDKFVAAGSNGLSLNFLEEFITARDISKGIGRWLRITAASLKEERRFAEACRLEGSMFNFWQYLKAEWAESMRGWRCLERCLFNLAFERYCRLAGQQRWTLFALENCPWERMLTEAARRVAGNGPVFGAQHSTIRPTDFRYFDSSATFTQEECAAFQPDVVAGNGKSAVTQWLENGMPKTRLREVEALRYLYLAKRMSRQKPEPDSGVIQPKRLLIATSFFKAETDFMLKLVGEALAAGLLDNYELI